MDRLIRPKRERDENVSEIDRIDDPLLLGHALSELKTGVEEYKYTSFCRVSGLATLCPRQQILGLRFNILKKEWISIGTKMIYDKGNAYHRWVQNDPLYFGERRIGWWKCLACGNKRFGKPPKVKCKVCGALPDASLYEEHEMQLEHPLRVSGHPDMLLEVGPGDVRVVELKSIKGEDWEKLKAPLAANLYQINGYMTFLRYDKSLPVRVNSKKGIVIYITKKDGANTFPMKAWHVRRDELIVKSMVEDLRQFKKAYDDPTYTPPVLSVCLQSGWLASRAKNCGCVKECKETYESSLDENDD